MNGVPHKKVSDMSSNITNQKRGSIHITKSNEHSATNEKGQTQS